MEKGKVRIIGKSLWEKVAPFFYVISPVLASKIYYSLTLRKRVNLDNPKDFNEKLMWLKLYWNEPLVWKCVDKYLVREYLESCGYADNLPKLYSVYSRAADIEWDKLPEKFVLKCTHGCGFNIICNDKSKLDKRDAAVKLDKWLKTRYVYNSVEVQYDKIIPRIICEEYIETKDGLLPNDYKIYCFNGEPRLTLICTERDTDLKLKWVDNSWKEMHIGHEGYLNKNIPRKPKWLKEMLSISKELSKPFPFVRIDFYDREDKPVFGEMTFTPAGCAARYYNQEGLSILGDMIILPEKK